MTDGFAWLLDTAPFDHRWRCVGWVAWVGWTLLISNAITAVASVLMTFPITTVYRAHRLRGGAVWLLAGSATMITLQGGHHFLYDVAFYVPAYRLMAVNDALMAAVSLVMCIAFFALAPGLCRMRPASELDSERCAKDAAIAELESAHRELDEHNIKLINTVNDLRRSLAVYDAHYDRDRAHREIIQAIETISDQLPTGTSSASRLKTPPPQAGPNP